MSRTESQSVSHSASFRRLLDCQKEISPLKFNAAPRRRPSSRRVVLRFRNNLSMFVTASRALFSPAAAKRSPGPISDYHPCSHALDVFSARWLTTHMYEKSSARFRELAAGLYLEFMQPAKKL